MSIIGAAIITFFAMGLMTMHMSRSTLQRMAGYALWCDLLVHGTVLYVFFGTSTLGLLQAELSAIFFTLALRAYRYMRGYQRLEGGRWITYTGVLQ